MSCFFQALFGFEEENYPQTQAELAKRIAVEADPFAPGWQKVFFRPSAGAAAGMAPIHAGIFRFDTVAELRRTALQCLVEAGYTAVMIQKDHTSGDSRALHSHYPNGLFQAASQFNCLEFPSQNTVPDAGIAPYIYDQTQGPACAIACAAGTAFRNYFAPVADDLTSGDVQLPQGFTDASQAARFGQTKARQLNGLASLEKLLAPTFDNKPLWIVRNGYIELTNEGLQQLPALEQKFGTLEGFEKQCIDLVRVGCHFDSEVTDKRSSLPPNAEPALVSQVFASACSVGYSNHPQEVWAPIAKIALKGAYEATFYAYVIHCCRLLKLKKTPGALFLTKLGGGVFANPSSWICDAMIHAEKATVGLFADAAAAVLAKGGAPRPGFTCRVLLTHFSHTERGYENFITYGRN